MGTGEITSCPKCGRRYPWTEKLDGKKLRCKCGEVFEAAIDLAAGAPETNTYDLSDDPPPPSRVQLSVATDPSAPGLPGGASGAPTGASTAPSRVLSYAHARPAEVAERRARSPLKELYLPITLLLLGVAFRVVQVVMETGGPGGFGGAIGLAVVGIVLNVGLTLAAVFVSAKLLGVDFGDFAALVLKVAAVGVLGGAVGAFIISLSPKDMTGPIVALHVVMILYWILFYSFFEIDVQESLMTVAIILLFHIAAFCIVFKPMGA